MSSNPATNLESIDTFFGYKLLDYVEPAEFFRLLKKYDIDENITKNKSILELYKLIPKKVFNKIFFDCVMFNHLKNIFIYNISVDKKKFKSEVIDILKEINNSSHIPEITKSFLKKEGFNLMTILGDQTKLGDKFVLGLEYVENEEFDQARMLFSHVVLTKSNKIIHNVCGLIVDFSKQKCLILLKNFTNLEKGHTPDLIEDLKITLPSYRDWIKKKFNSLVNFQSHNVDEVRLKMFKICKNFDDALLSEDRAFVTEKLESRVSKNINEYLTILTSDKNTVSYADKESLKKNILSLLSGVYVKSKYKSTELQKRAKLLKLDGYATKIQYTSTKFDKGATQSSSKSEPIASSEIYHSIYNNFSESGSLEKWCIAWFTDYHHTDSKNYDVIQTSIYVKLDMTHVVFLPTRALNEELINHVIGKISE